MSSDLKILFEFQFVIADMQKLLLQAKMKNPNADYVSTEQRIDKLIEVYKNYDKLYFSAYYGRERIATLQSDILKMGEQINALQLENEKLLKSLEWNTAT